MECKEDYSNGEKVLAADLNQISKNANDGGGFKDDLNAGETINGETLPVAIFIKDSDNEVYVCDGNDLDKLDFVGFAISNSTDGNPIKIQTGGIVRGFSGLDIGKKYYVQDDKTIGTSIGTYEILVGLAVSATEIFIQKASLQYSGIVSGTVDSAYEGSLSTVTVTVNPNVKIMEVEINGYVDGNGSWTTYISSLHIIPPKKLTQSLTISYWSGSTLSQVTVSISLSGTTLTITAPVDSGGGSRTAHLAYNIYYFK